MDHTGHSFEGYVTDIPYVGGFFKELTPSYLRTLMLLQQCDLPERGENEPLRYLELGYGQGYSLSIHACSNQGEFWGTDFNPSHALIAQKNMQKAEGKAHILNDSFAELARKAEQGLLPNFDIIVLHGIWSWVNEENREQVLSIISNALKVGGLVYVSYNALPGYANFAPVRDFFMYHASAYNYSANTNVSKLQNAFGVLKTLKNAGARYFAANPSASHKFEDLEKKNLAYAVHEYMNKSWKSFYFKDVSKDMHAAKCSYFGSARPLTALNFALPQDIKKLLESTTDMDLRETIRDYTNNTQFRCDVFSKGRNILDPETFINRLNELSFVLMCTEDKFNYKVKSPMGEINCNEASYKPVVSLLASNDYAPKSFKEISQLEAYKQPGVLLEVLTVLLGAGIIHPAQEVTAEKQTQCDKLNTHFCSKGLSAPCQFVASPVTGSGVFASGVEQAFLYAKIKGHKTPKAYVSFIYDIYKKRKQKLVHEGKELNDKEAVKHLTGLAEEFEKRLPLLRALKIIGA